LPFSRLKSAASWSRTGFRLAAANTFTLRSDAAEAANDIVESKKKPIEKRKKLFRRFIGGAFRIYLGQKIF
jgi:hypothetical protein